MSPSALRTLNPRFSPLSPTALLLSSSMETKGYRLMRADVVMTAGLVSSQFIMYGAINNAMGAGAGVEIHKEDAVAPPSAGGH